MEITEVRIKLMEDPQERLQAFCSVTFDHCFVIRDLKIIEGTRGSFVAMPSRKLTDRCPRCGTKNHLRAGYCNQCGAHLREDRAGKDGEGRARLYADIAHPINARCREQIQARIMQAFAEEQVRARQPGYVCTYDDYGEDGYAVLDDSETALPCTSVEFHGQTLRMDGPDHDVPAPHGGPHFGSALQRTADRRLESVSHSGDSPFSSHDEGFGAGVGDS